MCHACLWQQCCRQVAKAAAQFRHACLFESPVIHGMLGCHIANNTWKREERLRHAMFPAHAHSEQCLGSTVCPATAVLTSAN